MKLEYFLIIQQLNLTPETYILLKQSYSGGFTHASAWYSMKTLNNVSSYDETSAYVGQFASKKFPMSEPLDMSDIVNKNNLDKLLDKFCCLFEITLYDVKAIFLYESFLSKSKSYGSISSSLYFSKNEEKNFSLPINNLFISFFEYFFFLLEIFK